MGGDIKNNDSEYSQNLKQKIIDKKKEKDKAIKDRNSGIVVGIIFLILSILGCLAIIFFSTLNIGWYIFLFFLVIIGILALLGSLLYIPDYKLIKNIQSDIDMMNDELELYETRHENERILAEKQFKIHQKELKRYYDINLSQIRFLSVLGIVLIIFGVLIVVGSIVVYILVRLDTWLFIVSIISGILIDGIGAFFISMYTSNMKVAIALHSKLTDSNNLLLANLIVAKIDDKDIRNTTLAEISKNISSSNVDYREVYKK